MTSDALDAAVVKVTVGDINVVAVFLTAGAPAEA